MALNRARRKAEIVLTRSNRERALEAQELLRRARELVQTPRQWTTGAYARDRNGEPVPPAPEFKPRRFCAAGALLFSETEKHHTWIEPTPGFYFETLDNNMDGPPRLLLALDLLAAGLLAEPATATINRTRPENQRRIDYGRLPLTQHMTDVADIVNDHPLIRHAQVLRGFDYALAALNKTLAEDTRPPQQQKPNGGGKRTERGA